MPALKQGPFEPETREPHLHPWSSETGQRPVSGAVPSRPTLIGSEKKFRPMKG